MGLNVAINGFGRIGRCIARLLSEKPNVNLAAINMGTPPLENHLHLLKYDTNHGRFNDASKVDENTISLNEKKVPILFERDPKNIEWSKYKIDVVLECTGKFTDKDSAYTHIQSGAKKVVVSAPCKDADSTIVLGVNEQALSPAHEVISIGSCTTNCLAPIAYVLHKNLGIEQGYITTIHAYTNDQKVLDSRHKDKRRARSCTNSIIPTSTGAAKSIGLVIPELAGKLDGIAVRVPVPNVSMLELTFTSSNATDANRINALLQNSAKAELRGILDYTEEELVSVDFNHTTHSAIVDANLTRVIGKNFCKVSAWYDNEWAFANRMVEMVEKIS